MPEFSNLMDSKQKDQRALLVNYVDECYSIDESQSMGSPGQTTVLLVESEKSDLASIKKKLLKL